MGKGHREWGRATRGVRDVGSVGLFLIIPGVLSQNSISDFAVTFYRNQRFSVLVEVNQVHRLLVFSLEL